MIDLLLYDLPDAGTAIINVFIFFILVVGIYFGYKRGFNKSCISFLGIIIVLFGAYFLKNPISIFFYKHLPFFNFGGPLAGVTVLNILLYEFLAFLVTASLLYIILRIIAVFTTLVDKLLSIILSLGIPSELLGAIIGFMEFYVILYAIIFMFTSFANIAGIELSPSIADNIRNTPVLNETVGKTLSSFVDVTALINDYKMGDNNKDFNYAALEILLKNKIISIDNAKELLISGKIDIPNFGKLISKYE